MPRRGYIALTVGQRELKTPHAEGKRRNGARGARNNLLKTMWPVALIIYTKFQNQSITGNRHPVPICVRLRGKTWEARCTYAARAVGVKESRGKVALRGEEVQACTEN